MSVTCARHPLIPQAVASHSGLLERTEASREARVPIGARGKGPLAASRDEARRGKKSTRRDEEASHKLTRSMRHTKSEKMEMSKNFLDKGKKTYVRVCVCVSVCAWCLWCVCVWYVCAQKTRVRC